MFGVRRLKPPLGRPTVAKATCGTKKSRFSDSQFAEFTLQQDEGLDAGVANTLAGSNLAVSACADRPVYESYDPSIIRWTRALQRTQASPNVLMKHTAILVLACAVCAWPHSIASQQVPELAGVELGVSLGSFPQWALMRNSNGGRESGFNRHTVFGATFAVFPVPYIGVRGRVESVGVRIGSDRGFDLWKLGLEGRFVRFGALTPFVIFEVGNLAATSSYYMRLGSAGAGAVLRISDVIVLTLGADFVWPFSAGQHGNLNRPDRVLPSDIEREPFLPRVTITWRPFRFSP
jgi:hypothetical protein